ncbi:MAG: hypothetical protein Fur0034_02050 [Desulfuromonadia bacterium]
MPMTLASCRPAEISTLRAATQIRERLREEMVRHDEESGGETGVAYRKILADRILHEIVREREFRAALARIATAIGESPIRGVAILHDEGKRIIFSHFSLRRSPSLIHKGMTLLQRSIVSRCAAERGLTGDSGWTLLAAGPLGRGEATCCSRVSLVVIHDGSRPDLDRLFPLLVETGIEPDGSFPDGGVVIRAGLDQWQETVAAYTASSSDVSIPLADLSVIAGDRRLGAEAIRIASIGLVRWKSSAAFPLVARQVGGIRPAVGFFGGFRVERSGPYRGCIDLDADALFPLTASVRLLAVGASVEMPGTVDRVRELVARRWLGVEPATSIVDAFHAIATIRGGVYGNRGCEFEEHRYVCPDELSPADQEMLRTALETTSSLQRLMIHSIVGRR